LPGTDFDIVRIKEYLDRQAMLPLTERRNFYSCDDVCADRGQKCIGTGLTNPSVSRCVFVAHHVGNICELSGNLNKSRGCSNVAIYLTFSTCLELSSPCRPGLEPCGTYTDGQSYVQFSVGETACYCQ
jgi:hypothetical protein